MRLSAAFRSSTYLESFEECDCIVGNDFSVADGVISALVDGIKCGFAFL